MLMFGLASEQHGHDCRLWRLLGDTEECAEPNPKAAGLATSLDSEAALFNRMAALATAAEAAFPLGERARVLDPSAAAGADDAQRMASDGMLVRQCTVTRRSSRVADRQDSAWPATACWTA